MRTLADLDVYAAGELTVVGFGGREFVDDVSIAGCREQILELLQTHDCRTLAIDLRPGFCDGSESDRAVREQAIG